VSLSCWAGSAAHLAFPLPLPSSSTNMVGPRVGCLLLHLPGGVLVSVPRRIWCGRLDLMQHVFMQPCVCARCALACAGTEGAWDKPARVPLALRRDVHDVVAPVCGCHEWRSFGKVVAWPCYGLLAAARHGRMHAGTWDSRAVARCQRHGGWQEERQGQVENRAKARPWLAAWVHTHAHGFWHLRTTAWQCRARGIGALGLVA
jgi:hypothetical protein